MGQVVTIGLDIAKSVFQVHGVDAEGQVVVRRQVRRAELMKFFGKQPACLVGIEACASGHHWARELSGLGHRVRLMPPSYVKPYVKRQKNDAADAEAICEAVTRPTMRFVEVKSPEQQSVMVLHRPTAADVHIHLAKGEPSTHGETRLGDRKAACRRESAVGGADLVARRRLQDSEGALRIQLLLCGAAPGTLFQQRSISRLSRRPTALIVFNPGRQIIVAPRHHVGHAMSLATTAA